MAPLWWIVILRPAFGDSTRSGQRDGCDEQFRLHCMERAGVCSVASYPVMETRVRMMVVRFPLRAFGSMMIVV
jgi:hypothetical protein